MYSAILIIQIIVGDATTHHPMPHTYVDHIKHINDGKYSYNTCQWKKVAFKRVWEKRADIVWSDFDCLEIWRET